MSLGPQAGTSSPASSESKITGAKPERTYDAIEHWIAELRKIIDMGAAKHGADSWLDQDNPSLTHKANHASMSRHLAEHYCGIEEDHESGLNPLYHLACRALMKAYRQDTGIDNDAIHKQ